MAEDWEQASLPPGEQILTEEEYEAQYGQPPSPWRLRAQQNQQQLHSDAHTIDEEAEGAIYQPTPMRATAGRSAPFNAGPVLADFSPVASHQQASATTDWNQVEAPLIGDAAALQSVSNPVNVDPDASNVLELAMGLGRTPNLTNSAPLPPFPSASQAPTGFQNVVPAHTAPQVPTDFTPGLTAPAPASLVPTQTSAPNISDAAIHPVQILHQEVEAGRKSPSGRNTTRWEQLVASGLNPPLDATTFESLRQAKPGYFNADGTVNIQTIRRTHMDNGLRAQAFRRSAGNFSQPASAAFQAPTAPLMPLQPGFGQQTASVPGAPRFAMQSHLEVVPPGGFVATNVSPEPDYNALIGKLHLFPVNLQSQAAMKDSCKIRVAHVANATALLTPQKIQNHHAALTNLRKPLWRKITRRILTLDENQDKGIDECSEEARQQLLLRLKALEQYWMNLFAALGIRYEFQNRSGQGESVPHTVSLTATDRERAESFPNTFEGQWAFYTERQLQYFSAAARLQVQTPTFFHTDVSNDSSGGIQAARQNFDANMTLAAMDWQIKFFSDWINQEENKKNRNIMLGYRRFVVEKKEKNPGRTKTGKISKKKPGMHYVATDLLTGATGVVFANFRDHKRHYHEEEVKDIIQSHAAWKINFNSIPKDLDTMKKLQDKHLDELKRGAILDNFPIKRAIDGWEHQGLPGQAAASGQVIHTPGHQAPPSGARGVQATGHGETDGGSFSGPSIGPMGVQGTGHGDHAEGSFSGPFASAIGVHGAEYGEHVDGSFSQSFSGATESQATDRGQNADPSSFQSFAGPTESHPMDHCENTDGTNNPEVQVAEQEGNADSSSAAQFANDGYEETSRRWWSSQYEF
jgi:hypothetical protein